MVLLDRREQGKPCQRLCHRGETAKQRRRRGERGKGEKFQNLIGGKEELEEEKTEDEEEENYERKTSHVCSV